MQDRAETVLPGIVNELEVVALPASFDPPPPQPTEEDLLAGLKPRPLAPEPVRTRSCWIKLRDVPEGPLKGILAYYMAWVVDVSEDRSDPWLRRAGERSGPGQKDLVPSEVDVATVDTAFYATGGLREVCYLAVAEDPSFPAILTLYRGSRSPVGGEGSLLDPKTLDTLAAIHEKCRPVEKGLLHLEARWRRAFATSWQETSQRRLGEHAAYVGPLWDSTRALDPKFPLHVGSESLIDPSDDLFPAWVRLEVTLVAPSTLGFGRGETLLLDSVGPDDDVLMVEDPTLLVGPGPDIRWIKVDGEWMQYRPGRVDTKTGKVPVDRGLRGTSKTNHEEGAEVYLGLRSRRIVRLLSRDLFARPDKKR